MTEIFIWAMNDRAHPMVLTDKKIILIAMPTTV